MNLKTLHKIPLQTIKISGKLVVWYNPTGNHLHPIANWQTGQILRCLSEVILISLNSNTFLGEILVLAFKDINLTLTIIFLASKSWDQNCPGHIPRLKDIGTTK